MCKCIALKNRPIRTLQIKSLVIIFDYFLKINQRSQLMCINEFHYIVKLISEYEPNAESSNVIYRVYLQINGEVCKN